jgi:predicted amidohydrolase YtcJ
MTPTTLYRNGRVHSPADPAATALLVQDGRIAWLGSDADAPTGADAVYDLAGGLLAPAFVDAHVHTTDTGIVLLGLNLAGTRSAAEVLERVTRHAARLPADSVVLGHGWDESFWADETPPTAAQLDRAGAGRRVYLAQASVHSALVSSALLAQCPPDTPGWSDTGLLRRDAHHVVRELAMGALTPGQRRIAQRGALSHAASLGIAAVHECGGPGTSSEEDFLAVLALGASGELPEVLGYWGELNAAAKARELGAVGNGGDLYADGALGSRTAHLRQPYIDTDGCGAGYVSADQVAQHLVQCEQENMQGGFHAIGDKAIATVLAGFALAAANLGVETVRDARHRIEHLEILDRQLIAGLVNFGVTASVQPAFDRLWGGDDAMYAHRLGVARSLASNPFGALAGVGVPMAFGSDAPVTPLDPWGTIRAAMRHHNPSQRLGPRVGFAAHTRGGWRAARRDDEGQLVPGAPATFAVWQPTELVSGLPRLVPADEDEPAPPLPVCRRTVLRGNVIFDGA